VCNCEDDARLERDQNSGKQMLILAPDKINYIVVIGRDSYEAPMRSFPDIIRSKMNSILYWAVA